MLILSVRRRSPVPVYRQILERIVELVDAGVLAPGERLPPTRVLARTAGVHRSTVLRAYEELWALGYLESRPGSYSTVRRRMRPVAAAGGARMAAIDWHAVATPAARRAYGRERTPECVPARADAVDFARLAADPALAPTDEVRRCVRAVLLEEGARLLDYGDPAGYPRLRAAIARRMQVHGVEVSAAEILPTSGAQHALDLIARLLARPGDRVIVESPTYGAALSLFRVHGLDIGSVPMREDGMDLEALERALDRRRPAFVYTMPNFQNPTGITTTHAHRERLLALCGRRRVPLVEDGFEEEMKYFGRVALPIKAMDRGGTVIYVGTFSKVVFPGLRVGWVAAPAACVERLVALQRVSALGGNLLAQAIAARFCAGGAYEAYLRRAHAVHRRRMQTLLKALAAHVPATVATWTHPAGGYTVWLSVGGTSENERSLLDRFAREGVRVVAGSEFFPNPSPRPHFRLSTSCVPEVAIVEGCRRIGRALRAAAVGHE